MQEYLKFEYLIYTITIISFCIQLLPYFKRYKTLLSYFTTMFVGIVLGIWIGALQAVSINTLELNFLQVMLIGIMIIYGGYVLITSLLYMLNINFEAKEEMFMFSLLTFIFSSVILAASLGVIDSSHISDSEKFVLAKHYESNGDIYKAVEYYGQLLRKSENGYDLDIPQDTLRKKIDSLVNSQKD